RPPTHRTSVIFNSALFLEWAFEMQSSKQYPHLIPLSQEDTLTPVRSKTRRGELRPKRQRRAFSLGAMTLILTFAATFALLFSGCETANYAPQITSRRQDVDLRKLEHGRTLFTHRCIECHTLPPIWKYSRDDWPQLVNSMSHRANLSAVQRE